MKKMNLSRHVIGGLAAASLTATAATVETWTGGDKSAYQDEGGKALTSFDVPEFWDGGVAPVNNQTTAYAFTIAADGDYAKHISNNTQHFIQSDLTIGGADNPNVTLEFVSTRGVIAGQPDNSSPACLRTGGTISLLGNNTTIKVGKGFLFGTRGDYKPSVNTFVIDPGVKFEGEGILNWGGTHLLVAAHDYGKLWLRLGQENGNDIEYTAQGDITTTGRLELQQGGSGGVGGRAVLKMDGHTISVGQVDLGTLDNRSGDDGNQSSFGGIRFEGGTLKVAGDINFIGDPDGVNTQQVPLPREHRITTDQMGGTLEVGGSIGYRNKSDDGWYLRDLALVLNGDGTEQELELLTEDVGDTALCLYKNTTYGSVTVKAGAAVKLVDTYVNDRRTPGKAEALYTLDLTVEEGATLDLNGQSLYVYNEPTLAGEVLNGTVIRLRKAGFFSTVEYTLGTPGEVLTGGLGHWVGPMVAGDFDKDGKPELALVTLDEKREVAGSEFHLLKIAGETVSEVAPFPIADTTVLLGRAQDLLASANNQSSAMVNPFMFEDLGDGKGPRLIYTHSSYSDVIAIAPDGQSAETLEPACSYGNDNFVLVDLDGDGVKDIVTCYRNAGNLRAYSVAKKTELWRQTLAADAGIVVRVGVADLNGDHKLEVMALTKGAGGDTGYGFYVFNRDGTPFVNAKGKELTDVKLPYARGEGGGALIAKDVTGDGIPEIFIVDTNTQVGSTYGYLLVLDQDGQTLFWTQATEAPNKYSSPNVQFFDMDGDRICEFLYDGRIYNGKFEEIDRLPVPAECLGVCVRLSPALVDMTGDQVPEIVYGCRDKAWNDYDNARWIAAYDPVKKELLTGFPIKLQYSQDTGANDWHAGSCAHWNFANLIVADFDGDNKWEIVVGIGAVTGNTAKRAALNIIKTPYGYDPKVRKQEKCGAWQYGRGPLMDFTYPLARKEGFAIFVR